MINQVRWVKDQHWENRLGFLCGTISGTTSLCGVSVISCFENTLSPFLNMEHNQFGIQLAWGKKMQLQFSSNKIHVLDIFFKFNVGPVVC